jgi:hypothetical protein
MNTIKIEIPTDEFRRLMDSLASAMKILNKNPKNEAALALIGIAVQTLRMYDVERYIDLHEENMKG